MTRPVRRTPIALSPFQNSEQHLPGKIVYVSKRIVTRVPEPK